MKLKDKVAIITGGARGIGRAICERFSQEGAKVVINFNPEDAADAEQGEQLLSNLHKNGGEALLVGADISKRDQVEQLIGSCIEVFGRLDVMVCNAGICPFEEFTKITDELWDRVQDVNLKGAFLCSQIAAIQMIKQKKGGRLLFTSSVSSIFGGSLQAHYCPTKGGINQLMKSVAISMGPYNITANAVLPGTIVTDINRKQLEERKIEATMVGSTDEKLSCLSLLPVLRQTIKKKAFCP